MKLQSFGQDSSRLSSTWAVYTPCISCSLDLYLSSVKPLYSHILLTEAPLSRISTMPSLPSVFRFPKQQQTYEAVGHMSEPYDEAYSIKALLSEETSSDSNSSEHLPPYRLIPAPAKNVHTLFLVLNIVFFVFSAFLFGISTAPTLWPKDRFNNTLLRQTSEHCLTLRSPSNCID